VLHVTLASATSGDLIGRLGSRLESVSATCSTTSAEKVAAEVAATLARAGVTAWVAVPGMPESWLPDGAIPETAYLDLARDVTAGRLGCVELAALAVAETGSLMTHGSREIRQLAMLSDVQLLLVRAADVVADLDQAAAAISAMQPPPPHFSFVTGASRTSDIERTLAIGVHGPSQLYVMVVDQ
jgi:L-lactate dehydrogenase complex protein LldG